MSLTTNRRLGDNQRSVLQALKRHSTYFHGCGWVWNSRSGTEKILDSLVKRGLVEVVAGQHTDRVWRLTKAGEIRAS